MHPAVVGGLIALVAKCLIDADRGYQKQIREQERHRLQYEQARAARQARRVVIGLLIQARKQSVTRRSEFFASVEQLKDARSQIRDYLKVSRPRGEEGQETNKALDRCEEALDLNYARIQREKEFSAEVTSQLDWIHEGGQPRAWVASSFLPPAPSADIPDSFPVAGRLTSGEVVSSGVDWQILVHGRYTGHPCNGEPPWDVKVGQWLDVVVDGAHYKEGTLWVSHARANLVRATEQGGSIAGRAVEKNSGGFVFEVLRNRVFVPRSLLRGRYFERDEEVQLRVVENDHRWRRIVAEPA